MWAWARSGRSSYRCGSTSDRGDLPVVVWRQSYKPVPIIEGEGQLAQRGITQETGDFSAFFLTHAGEVEGDHVGVAYVQGSGHTKLDGGSREQCPGCTPGGQPQAAEQFRRYRIV